jgi:hypothetical protein
MDRQRYKLDQVGIRTMHAFRRNWQRATLLEERLCHILKSAGNQKPCVGQIEALRHGPGKVQRLRHNHFTRRMREVKRDVVLKHTSMILRDLPDAHTDRE